MSPRRLLAFVLVVLLGCGRSPQRDFEQGITCFKAEKFSKAEACFQRAVEHAAPTAQALNFIGVCRLQEGKTDAAIQNFQDALKLDPGHAAARYNLALAYFHASAWAQARQALQRSAESAEVLNCLGIANAHLGNYREARDNFEAALKLAPKYAPASLNLAVIEHRHLDQKQSALKRYRRFLELQPRDDVRQVKK